MAAALRFTVRRKAVELLAPAGPTPRELKRLSDIDDQEALRRHTHNIQFFHNDASMSARDPATVVRDAVARALVHYYPFAGRLRELQGRKLAVDCTGEGVLFIEADADVRLEHFGDALHPPFPGVEELVFDVPGSSQVLGTPLLLFQVTRLSCGGFILAVRLNHTMADARGLMQFLAAVAELARGAAVPSVRPVWGREVLEARNPPSPSFAHRQYDEVPGAIMPLEDMEVTRLSCGSFILAVRLNHTMADAQGLMQFLAAVAELARGAAVPSVRPVWGREVLEARNPPRPSFAHRQYDEVPGAIMPLEDMELRSFFFGAKEVASVRSHLTPALQKHATTFEVLVGFLWKCRTAALAPGTEEEMRMMFAVDARGRSKGKRISTIPTGYYGNAIVLPAAVSTAGELCAMPLSHAVRLVKEAKEAVGMDYLQSVADLMVQRGRPDITMAGAYMASDVTRAGFGELDYGWGRPVYAGPAMVAGICSFLISFKNAKGEDGIIITICLPRHTMDKFEQEMGKLLRPTITKSAL